MLKDHFSQEVFDKSQKYGKDKAKFALASGLYRQVMDSAMLQYGMYAWAWEAGGRFLTKVGYSTEHEVSKSAHDDILWVLMKTSRRLTNPSCSWLLSTLLMPSPPFR